MAGTTGINIKRVPSVLWKRIKLLALEKDRDLRFIVIDALEEYLSNHETKVNHAP